LRLQLLDPHHVQQGHVLEMIGDAVTTTDADDHAGAKYDHLVGMAYLICEPLRGMDAKRRERSLTRELVKVLRSHRQILVAVYYHADQQGVNQKPCL